MMCSLLRFHALVFLSIISCGVFGKVGDEVAEVDFVMNESIKSMGDSIYLKNEYVCSGDIEIRMESNFKSLEECTVVEGDLVIATVNMRNSKKSWYFPRLKEITGKLIVYYTNMKAMDMFPNLVVIRGRNPIGGFSMVVMDTIFTHLHLPSLRLIQDGGVRVNKNHVMCHVNTIDWSVVLNGRSSYELGKERRSLIMVDDNRGICPDLCNENRHCPTSMINEKKIELCWSPNVCQSVCSTKCRNERLACWMNNTARCCHPECLGGCYGNGSNLCVSCKNFLHNGQCVKECPKGYYEYLHRRCISKAKCFAKVASDPINYHHTVNYSLHEGQCVDLCPPRFRRNDTTGECVKCNPICPKRCGDAWVYGLKESDAFRGCSSVRKLHISIRDGGKAEQLMDRLRENFDELVVVEEYVKIINTGSLKTLSFLSNLRVIGGGDRNNSDLMDPVRDENVNGHAKTSGEPNVFEVVANDRLESLWKAKPRVKIYGRVSIHLNRQLCANKILDFLDNQVHLVAGNLSAQERTFIQRANGDLMPCNVSTINLTINSVSSRNVDVHWAQVDLNDRDLFVTLLMIKPTTKNISLAIDRASCETSSWQIHEATTCPKGTEIRNNDHEFPPLNQCTLTVPKLTPATRYAVYMESKTTQGDHGAVSPVVYFTTTSEPPTPPRDIEIEALSSSSLKVRWYPPKHPNGRVTTYLIWYRPMKLIKKEYKDRDFCAFKTLMGNEKVSQSQNELKKESSDTSLATNQNASVCSTCEECLKFCGNKKLFQQKEDVSYSFEDSLQNHIFVKRKVQRWDENGDSCFDWALTVKAFFRDCYPTINHQEKQKLKQTKRKPNSLDISSPTSRSRNTSLQFNNTRMTSSSNYTPFVTTAEDTSKSAARQDKEKSTIQNSGTQSPMLMSLPTTVAPTVNSGHKPVENTTTENNNTRPVTKSEWSQLVQVSADTTQYIFTGLEHYTEYIFAIRACQDSNNKDASTQPRDNLDDMYTNPEDEVSIEGYDNKVCSKMARATHRTLPSEHADRVNDSTIEVSREPSGQLHVLWSRPKDPNGMILLYWLQYRKKATEGSKDSQWHRMCVSVRKWEHDFNEYLREKSEMKSASIQDDPDRKRRSVKEYRDAGRNRSRFDSRRSLKFLSDNDDEQERGGYRCSGPAFSPGVYEFSIMAVSLAGNGSWSSIFEFVVNGDVVATDQYEITLVLSMSLVGVVLIFVAIMSTIIYMVRRRSQKNGPELIYPNPDYTRLPAPDEWEIPQEDIVYYNERALGKGFFGIVVKGWVKNLDTPARQYYPDSDITLAAIKMLRKESTMNEKIDFLNEASIMKGFHSFHIVQLLGVVSRMDTQLQVVMEFMSHGDLASYLRQIAETEAINMLHEAKILLWAAHIADGMAYLSDHMIVHRDLAARNCLVDANEVVKIGDFGLTKELYTTEEMYKKRVERGGVVGPYMWMAPESLCRGHYSEKSDVWSFGVVMWEVATLGARPFPNMSASAVKDYVLEGNHLLTRDDLWDNSWKKLCPQFVISLMWQCFERDKDNRPSFPEILSTLEPYFDDRFLDNSFYCSVFGNIYA